MSGHFFCIFVVTFFYGAWHPRRRTVKEQLGIFFEKHFSDFSRCSLLAAGAGAGAGAVGAQGAAEDGNRGTEGQSGRGGIGGRGLRDRVGRWPSEGEPDQGWRDRRLKPAGVRSEWTDGRRNGYQ